MKRITLLLLALAITGGAFAQDETADTSWKIKGDVSLMFSQSSYTNWASGGENSMTINGFFNYYAGYFKGKSKWETMLGLGYGQTKTGEQDFRKTEDKIDLLSNYGYQAAEKWFYLVNFNFKTQFAEGFKYHDDVDTLDPEKISNFMAPGYISLGLGMEYRPASFFSMYFSPVTARLIIVNDQELADAGAFGVDPAEFDPLTGAKLKDGEMMRYEIGAAFRMIFSKEILKNVNYTTKFELFSDYLENPQNIDVNWDNTLDFTINKILSAKFSWQVLYDDNTPISDKDGKVGPRTQFKEFLSIGLAYNFSN